MKQGQSFYAIDVLIVGSISPGTKVSFADVRKRLKEVPSIIGCSAINIDEVKIVQVGRLEYKNKGQDLLLYACSNLIKKGIKLHVDFIGNGTSANFLKQLSNELGISHFVSFLGFQTQEYLCHHLCDYDLFVQPSRYEGFGLTVAEAMSAKAPVIVSSGQGPAEVTENERFGWVFDNGEIQSLSSTILDVIMNYDYAHDKAEKAYQHVLRNYDVSVTALSYLNMYKKLLNRG